MRAAGLVVVWLLLGVSFAAFLGASWTGPAPSAPARDHRPFRVPAPVRNDWKRVGNLLGRCQSLAASPGGSMIAAGDDKGRIMIWDPSGNLLHSTSGHRGAVTAITFADDGDRVASAGEGDLVRLWSLRSGRWSALVSAESVSALAFSPDGRLLAVADGFGLVLADSGGGRVLRLATKLPARTTAMAWDAAGERMAVAGADGVVRVWDRDGRAIERRDMKVGSLTAVGWLGGTVVASGAEGKLRWWIVASGEDAHVEATMDRLVTSQGDLPKMPSCPIAAFRIVASAAGELIAVASEREIWIIRP